MHVHLLIWLEHVEAAHLERSIAAIEPKNNEPLRCLVEKSQRSWTGSGWPRQDAPSYYDCEAEVLRLQHQISDWCKKNAKGVNEGLRAYIADILASLGCHMDVQMSDGRGMLLRYVSGYVPKFSDKIRQEHGLELSDRR